MNYVNSHRLINVDDKAVSKHKTTSSAVFPFAKLGALFPLLYEVSAFKNLKALSCI